jgi:hypothetical protein
MNKISFSQTKNKINYMKTLVSSGHVTMPTAIITVNGNERKIYKDNKIFLNNGDNFEIKFFNPTKNTIGAKINFDGKQSNEYLILRPGEQTSINRFLNENKKMKFETYQVNNNEQTNKAIENNGLIEIFFFNEYIPFTYQEITYTPYKSPWDSPYESPYKSPYKLPYKSPYKSPYTYDTNNTSSYNIRSCNNVNTNFNDMNFCDSDNKIETGRIEKGETSEQSFTYKDIQFNIFSFHSIKYQLLPFSQKDSLNKVKYYCSKCNYRIRQEKWKHCPNCGTEL